MFMRAGVTLARASAILEARPESAMWGDTVAGTLIGRDRELAELTAGLRNAFDGRGGVFVVSGEPGIGKTELADRLANDARERGAQVAWGRCWEGDGAPPFWPWAQIVRSLAAEHDDDALRTFAGPGAAQVALLAPDLAERLGVSPDAARATDSEAGRFYLFEAVGRFLREASNVRPIVLVLDDLQDADRPSHHLLRFLAQDVRTSRILVVATYREVGGARPPDDVDVMVDLVREGQVLALRGLDRGEVDRLIEQTSGVAPWNGRAAAIHEATRGNPLFVREVTRLLAARGLLDRPGGPEIPLPQSVRAVIRQRLSPLSADTVRVLSAAAVVGRTFQVGLVVAASDLPMERVLATLSEATTMSVVSPAADSVGMYDFAHPLVREVIHDELPVPARMQLHQRVGEAIEDRHGPHARLHLSELAYHFGQVAPAGHGRKARDYATEAGDQAMEAGAYEDAIVEYGRAIEAHAFTDPDERVRCDLLLRLGDAQAKTGDYESSKATFLSAAEGARKLQDPERLAHAALGFGEPQVESGVVDRQLLSLLQEAVAGLDPDQDALRVRLLARHSLELTFSDEAETREALSQEAVEIARRLGEPAPLASALRARWMAAWGPDGLEERVDMAEEVLRLAVETGDRETELVGRARRVTCEVELGDLLAAEAEIAVHGELAGELRMPYHVWTAVSMRAMRALLQDGLDTAEALAQRALDVLPGKLNAVYAHLNQVTAIRWDQGRLAELRDAWREVVEAFPQAGFARGWLCLADAELGRQDEARRGLRALTDSVFTQPRDGIWPAALALAAVAAAELDDPDAAAAVLPLIHPYGEQTFVIPMPHPVTCFGSAWLYVALLETALERWDEADEHFGDAARSNGRMGARSLLARTQYEHARMLLRRGEGDDRERALELIDRAAATGASTGASAIAEGVRRLREDETGEATAGEAHAGEPAAPEPTEHAFRREGEYWTVVYEGSVARLRDSKGMRYLSVLLAHPGREFHAVDLETSETDATVAPRSGPAELGVRPDLGDAGEMLDATAKAAYKARLDELRAELEEAEDFNDPARVAKTKEEIDFLTSELARAVGLGGRDRRAASHAERARLNVTRAIRAAMGNLDRANPPLGRHLSSTIHTGRFCSYTPDPRAQVAWRS